MSNLLYTLQYSNLSTLDFILNKIIVHVKRGRKVFTGEVGHVKVVGGRSYFRIYDDSTFIRVFKDIPLYGSIFTVDIEDIPTVIKRALEIIHENYICEDEAIDNGDLLLILSNIGIEHHEDVQNILKWLKDQNRG